MSTSLHIVDPMKWNKFYEQINFLYQNIVEDYFAQDWAACIKQLHQKQKLKISYMSCVWKFYGMILISRKHDIRLV